jgi:hypothetical protein
MTGFILRKIYNCAYRDVTKHRVCDWGRRSKDFFTWIRYLQGRRKIFSIWGEGGGAEIEGRRPEKIFKFRVSEMPFSGPKGRFDRILMVRKQRFSMSNLQFSSTKWAKA